MNFVHWMQRIHRPTAKSSVLMKSTNGLSRQLYLAHITKSPAKMPANFIGARSVPPRGLSAKEPLHKSAAVMWYTGGGVDCCPGLGDETADAGGSGFERYAKTTRRAGFLAEVERVVPWSAL